MSIRTEIREIEKHVKSMTSDKSEQIAIISKVQSMTIDNEHNLAVLAIAKKRIIASTPRATVSDVCAMYCRLWGDETPDTMAIFNQRVPLDVLDQTQIGSCAECGGWLYHREGCSHELDFWTEA